MRLIYILFIFCILLNSALSQSIESPGFQTGIQLGFGFPRIPDAVYRSTFSMTGGLFLQYRMTPGYMIGLCGIGLTTFQLGKIHGETGSLRFKIADGSLNFYKRFRGFWENESFGYISMGYTQIFQKVNGLSSEKTGTSVGMGYLSQYKHRQRITQIKIEYRLFLLEGKNPQVLLTTFGIGL